MTPTSQPLLQVHCPEWSLSVSDVPGVLPWLLLLQLLPLCRSCRWLGVIASSPVVLLLLVLFLCLVPLWPLVLVTQEVNLVLLGCNPTLSKTGPRLSPAVTRLRKCSTPARRHWPVGLLGAATLPPLATSMISHPTPLRRDRTLAPVVLVVAGMRLSHS